LDEKCSNILGYITSWSIYSPKAIKMWRRMLILECHLQHIIKESLKVAYISSAGHCVALIID